MDALVRRSASTRTSSSTRSSPPIRRRGRARRCCAALRHRRHGRRARRRGCAGRPTAARPSGPSAIERDREAARMSVAPTAPQRLSHLAAARGRGDHVMREVAAEFERPVLLFSGGKDSIVLLRLAEKAFRPGPLPVPGPARRHGPQLPRGDRVPRPPRGRARRGADRRVRAGRRSTPAAPTRRPATRRATGCRRSRCSTRWPSTASTRRSAAPAATRSAPARRSACCPSATSTASGTRARSGPSSWNLLQHRRPPRRERARVPALATGPSSTSGATSRPRSSRCRRSTSPTSARSSSATGCCSPSRSSSQPDDGETVSRERVRYRTVGDMTVTGAVRSDGRRRRRDHRGDGRLADRPSAAPPAPTTARRRPRWRTASARATSSGRPRRTTCCASPPPGPSTTASRR